MNPPNVGVSDVQALILYLYRRFREEKDKTNDEFYKTLIGFAEAMSVKFLGEVQVYADSEMAKEAGCECN